MPVDTKPAPAAARRGSSIDRSAVAFAAVMLVLALALTELVRTPAHVPGITIANPTRYALDVAVADRPSDGIVPLGQVGPRSSERFEQVLDQGGRWYVQVEWHGDVVDSLSVSRAELARNGWRFELPGNLGERLAATDAGPAPTPTP